MKYVALLRGINVGGNTIIKIADLKQCLTEAGLKSVKTYIQSGNIIFESSIKPNTLPAIIQEAINDAFKLDVSVLVIGAELYKSMLKAVPKGWGEDPEFKYNLLFLLPPYNETEIIKSIGELKPEIEQLTAGKGVIYQAISIKLFGKTTSGKLASTTVYKRMTVRNHRTVNKLLELLQGD